MKSGWVPFQLPFNIGSGRSFGYSPDGKEFVRMDFFKDEKSEDLVGYVTFGRGIEGPPHHVHGGVSAFVLDEIMGSSAWLKGYTCVAAKIEVEFLKMTPVEERLNVRGHVLNFSDPLVEVKAEIFDDSGAVFSRSRGFFHQLSKEKIDAFKKVLEQS